MQQMSARRDPKSWCKLTRYRSATHLVRGLKHENRATAASEIRRANKPVVTAADDDAVITRPASGRRSIHIDAALRSTPYCVSTSRVRPISRRIAPAALYPGAP